LAAATGLRARAPRAAQAQAPARPSRGEHARPARRVRTGQRRARRAGRYRREAPHAPVVTPNSPLPTSYPMPLSDLLIPEFDVEIATTIKVAERVPDDRLGRTPDAT